MNRTAQNAKFISLSPATGRVWMAGLAVAAAAAIACSDPGGMRANRDAGAGGSGGGAGASGVGGQAGGGAGGQGGSSGAGGSGALDAGEGMGGGPGADGGVGSGGDGGALAAMCKRVDIVFSIDDSSSMSEEQEVMGTIIFPAFAKKLLEIAPNLEDFRVGVMDACPKPANFHTRGLGGECMFQSGKPWMDSKSTKLVDEFACVGAIDSNDVECSGSNDDEQPASTIATSLEAPWHAPGGPNEGFLRDNAILVAIAMTDEDEQPVPKATAQEVYDRLVKIKGDVRKVVFLGIGGQTKCNGPYGSAKDAQVLKEVTALFEAQSRGVFWDICAGSFEEGLAKAIAAIKGACDELCKFAGTAC